MQEFVIKTGALPALAGWLCSNCLMDVNSMLNNEAQKPHLEELAWLKKKAPSRTIIVSLHASSSKGVCSVPWAIPHQVRTSKLGFVSKRMKNKKQTIEILPTRPLSKALKTTFSTTSTCFKQAVATWSIPCNWFTGHWLLKQQKKTLRTDLQVVQTGIHSYMMWHQYEVWLAIDTCIQISCTYLTSRFGLNPGKNKVLLKSKVKQV